MSRQVKQVNEIVMGQQQNFFRGCFSWLWRHEFILCWRGAERECGKIIKSSLKISWMSFLPRTSSALKISKFSFTGKFWWIFFLRKHLRGLYRNDEIYVLLVIMVFFLFFFVMLTLFYTMTKKFIYPECYSYSIEQLMIDRYL